jgi:hypothetical protein
MKRNGRRRQRALAVLDVETIETLLRLRDELAPALELARAQATRWYTVPDLAEQLHVRPRTAWGLVRPYRHRCHLGRDGSHPRKVLWIPADVVRSIQKARETALGGNPVKPLSR